LAPTWTAETLTVKFRCPGRFMRLSSRVHRGNGSGFRERREEAPRVRTPSVGDGGGSRRDRRAAEAHNHGEV
jgi:hypothetical protein